MSACRTTVPPVSRETHARLEIYAELLARWNRKINLVSPGSISDLWRRHIIDSTQLAYLAPMDARSWVDLGSGAGLPGLLVAAVRQETAPLERMVLIDSDTRKSAFMAEASRAMGVTVTIETRRLGEHIEPRPFDVVSARALSPLPKLLDYAEPFITSKTICLFPKGRNRATEIAAASRAWNMKVKEIESQNEKEGVILRLGDLSRLIGPQ
ncbi:16S rRNA (guanine(527)-N(7))-methyltransferase RsmG [Pikeienuella piscinae]|uniref:Ribosomal RNA small subunit methyltransferase G n=1 Tax=Pikeienuella piscinae TaxID=2748098 RepID=A0A7L5BZM5_9RHOB|nr:16S rRNA (guanine(527)-N(7))-methyltransferase RsmG [Pikeienuella piscinae]QIE56288.1 16S rRNA (guanine(527)-N(7))-methyltransferase RsmG [Pikeienuella piscinae]